MIYLSKIPHSNWGQRFYHSCLRSLKLSSECKLRPWTLLENACLHWNKHIITSNRSFCIKSILIIKVPSISSVAKCKRYKSESPEVDCCKEYHKAVAVFKRALSENITKSFANHNYWLLPGGLYTTTSPIPVANICWKSIVWKSILSNMNWQSNSSKICRQSIGKSFLNPPVTAFPQQKARIWPSSLVEMNLLCIRVSTINNVNKSTNYTRRLSVILAKKRFKDLAMHMKMQLTVMITPGRKLQRTNQKWVLEIRFCIWESE